MYALRSKLLQLKGLIDEGGATSYSTHIERVLCGSKNDLWTFLCSNELWGGAGSIADQALVEHEVLRKRLEFLLIEIAELQSKAGRVNMRTEMWVTSFKQSEQ